MAYKIMNMLGAQPIEAVSTTQNHPFGTRVKAYDDTYGEGEFVYVKGVTNGAAGLLCRYLPDDGVTVLSGARTKGLLGVMATTLDATTKFGWLQIAGVANATTPDGITEDSTVYLSGTAGNVTDSVTTGDIVYGAKFAAADATGRVLVALSYPFSGDTDNS